MSKDITLFLKFLSRTLTWNFRKCINTSSSVSFYVGSLHFLSSFFFHFCIMCNKCLLGVSLKSIFSQKCVKLHVSVWLRLSSDVWFFKMTANAYVLRVLFINTALRHVLRVHQEVGPAHSIAYFMQRWFEMRLRTSVNSILSLDSGTDIVDVKIGTARQNAPLARAVWHYQIVKPGSACSVVDRRTLHHK